MFKHIKADLAAHGGRWGAQGFWAMVVYRFGRWRYTIGSPWLRKPFSFFYWLLYKTIQIITGIELQCEVVVGPGFVIDHFGDIVISGYACFGSNCRIRNGVVVGLKNTDQPFAPQIGNNVDVGAGAKVLGQIRIGNNLTIGAKAVVTCDVPDNHIAVGFPAMPKPRRSMQIAL